MFAATQDKNGVHRLSIRRIRTITGYYDDHGVRMDIRFSSRAKAKECADALNEDCEYDRYFDLHTGNTLADVDISKAYGARKMILHYIEIYGGQITVDQKKG